METSGSVSAPGRAERRKLVEIICICVFCAGVLLFLTYYGRLHVKYLPSTRIRTIQEPREAFFVWKDAGVRGRTLVLFDRHLGDEQQEYSTFDFIPEQFGDPAVAENLCRAIEADAYGLPFPASAPCLERLNGLLYISDFYDAWEKKKARVQLPEKIKALVRLSRVYRGRSLDR